MDQKAGVTLLDIAEKFNQVNVSPAQSTANQEVLSVALQHFSKGGEIKIFCSLIRVTLASS